MESARSPYDRQKPLLRCTTQICPWTLVYEATLEKGDPVDVIYLDFKKAFDGIPLKRLLLKLEA